MSRQLLRPAAALLFAVLGLLPSCAHQRRNCAPTSPTQAGPLVDLSAPPGEDHAVEQGVINDLMRQTKDPSNVADPSKKRFQILALSGGAVYGAYTAGVLNGWSQSGERPTFDIVTGISTGGLISNLAFLGPAYDTRLCELYTTINSDDIFRRRPTIALLWSDSAASSAPLRRLVNENIDCQMLQQVAQAHAEGRRLYIGTTNLDTKRLIIWDMGAIASSNRPDKLELYRTIVVASASVPGFFPPVPISVTVNGQRATEMHGDGGTTSQVFLAGTALKFDPEVIRAGQKPLIGSDVYVILAGKLYGDPECVEPRIKSIASNALSSLTYAQARNDMIRIWSLCRLTGMGYHSTSIPLDFAAPTDSLDFRPEPMQRMFAEGMRHGMSPRSWRTTPPGTEPHEQWIPRAGTDFLAPIVCPRPDR